MDDCVISSLLVFVLITVVHGGEWCSNNAAAVNGTDRFWCDDVCCEDSLGDKYCCFSGEPAMIVGIVIACLVFIGLAVFGIVLCCEYGLLQKIRCCQRRAVTRQTPANILMMTNMQSRR